MDHLTKDQLATLQERLELERDTLLERQQGAFEEAPEGQVEVGDRQDRAAEEQQRASALNLAHRDRARLVGIVRAFDKLRDGTYGLCEETDEPIPYARLEIDPTTRYSVEVQELLEATRNVSDDTDGPY